MAHPPSRQQFLGRQIIILGLYVVAWSVTNEKICLQTASDYNKSKGNLNVLLSRCLTFDPASDFTAPFKIIDLYIQKCITAL